MKTTDKTFVDYFAALKSAADPKAMQEVVLGSTQGEQALRETFEALVSEAEEAGDNIEFEPAAQAFRKSAVLAWALGDDRMVENLSAQALYYGALSDLETLLENFAVTWALMAHRLPRMKPRERSRLQDFARFRRSLELGLRARKEEDQRLSAAVTLLIPAFEKLGAGNLKAMEDKKLDLTAETGELWDEVSRLIGQIEKSQAK